MEACRGERAKSLSSDCISGGYKNADRRTQQLLEVLSARGDTACQIIAVSKFRFAVALIVMVAMKHDFEVSSGDTAAQILDKRLVFVERMNGPAAAKPLRNTLAVAGPVEGDDGQ
jgi:hypothetical protein